MEPAEKESFSWARWGFPLEIGLLGQSAGLTRPGSYCDILKMSYNDEMETLTAEKMRTALKALDALLDRDLTLIVGGGGAMLLAYGFPLATADIDAVPRGIPGDELAPLIEKVARELGLPHDWLNPWYSSFTYVLPADFEERLMEVFRGSHLSAQALGKEDLLLMKCFAHRQKDVAHARALVRAGADADKVFDRIEELRKRKIPGTEPALDFLEDILDQEGK
jgi:hypothetical protein